MTNLSPGFKSYPKAGVISVMEEAAKLGFSYTNSDWFNLGQGGPELAEIDGCIPRVNQINLSCTQHGYAPVAGLPELRQKVADLYNSFFRKDKSQQYSGKNVLIGGGGRLVLSRIMGSFGNVKLGFFNPDYASYKGIMNVFNNVEPVEFRLDPEKSFKADLAELEKFIIDNGIQAFLISNPCNPTGTVIQGDELKQLILLAQKHNFSLIIDEFYFNHIYSNGEEKMVSAAEFIDSIEDTPIILVAGLSKAFRYPGWRLCWALGPANTIENISSVSSFLDGGASHPIQAAALELVEKDNLLQETIAIHHRYKQKRDYMINQLDQLGLSTFIPDGAFYVWVNLSSLPAPLNDGYEFFTAGLRKKVIVVPGEFFDLRKNISREENLFRNYIRLSFSPTFEVVKLGMEKMKEVVNE